MMERCAAAGTPGDPHRALQAFAGEWDVACEFFMGGPGSDAMTSKGLSRIRPVLGGRFLVEEFETTLMMPDPADPSKMAATPYQGLGYLGYDNLRKVYVGTWMDSMGTGILKYTGACDPAGKRFAMYGEMDEPALGVVGRMVKYVTQVVAPDRKVFECYDLHAGDDYLVMRLTYTRKK